jgi:hypothetical protein
MQASRMAPLNSDIIYKHHLEPSTEGSVNMWMCAGVSGHGERQ